MPYYLQLSLFSLSLTPTLPVDVRLIIHLYMTWHDMQSNFNLPWCKANLKNAWLYWRGDILRGGYRCSSRLIPLSLSEMLREMEGASPSTWPSYRSRSYHRIWLTFILSYSPLLYDNMTQNSLIDKTAWTGRDINILIVLYSFLHHGNTAKAN